MAKVIVHIVFIVLFVALCVFTVWSFAGGSTGEIIRLRSEIDKLGKQNKELAENNSRFETDIGNLQRERNIIAENNRRFEEAFNKLSSGAGSAGTDIQGALDGIRELKELAKEIPN